MGEPEAADVELDEYCRVDFQWATRLACPPHDQVRGMIRASFLVDFFKGMRQPFVLPFLPTLTLEFKKKDQKSSFYELCVYFLSS